MSSTSLLATVVRITYFNAENGYSVIRVKPDGKVPTKAKDAEGLVTITGNFPELAPGEVLNLQGEWTQHPKFGEQFQVAQLKHSQPTSEAGIQRYLGSGLLKGIGPATAKKIVEHFGKDTIKIIDFEPKRLREIKDIGPKRARQILVAWEEQKQAREIMLFLHSYGVSTNLATKIIRQYGDAAINVVKRDPYKLARDIFGVGFKTADKIAQSLGLPKEHPTRLEAGIVHLLNEAVSNGHVFLPQIDLIPKAQELLNVEGEILESAIVRLQKEQQIVVEISDLGPVLYQTKLHRAEEGLANKLIELQAAKPSRINEIPALELLSLPKHLSDEQWLAVESALKNPLSVLTGGPGTGKTTSIQTLIEVLEARKFRYALTSPTGRAAKRLSQATERPASTIHRLLGYSPQEGFKHNADNPLPLDLLVIDESSMLDLQLAFALVKALEVGTHLLLVGDVDQLPSVGAGDVLRDIIASGIAPITRLNVIFRQAKDSHIIQSAHLINQGQIPEFHKDSQDFFLFPADDGEKALDWIQDLLSNRIASRFDLDPMKDVQVLAPLYRGPAGVNALNESLQAALNPTSANKAEHSFFGQIFRVGDKLMQIRNDYDKQVFNGDIGYLIDINTEDHRLSVEIDGRPIEYDWSEADQLNLAYAVTVHKSQGSEFPALVMPILSQHYIMLQRNLLYTAITRAKKLCILVGNKKAIAIAVNNNKVSQRWSRLDERLLIAP